MPVGKVTADQSISLDGFSAGPNLRPGNPLGDQGERLHEWYEEGGAQVRDELFGAAGALVMGRRMFDVGVEPWGEAPPFHMPVFVVTHHPRKPLAKNGGTTYFFVTEGIRDVLSRARKAAGNKDVVVMGGANLIQQWMNAQLLDEMRIHIAHVLLGEGTRFFAAADAGKADLECARIIETPGATHLSFRIIHRGA